MSLLSFSAARLRPAAWLGLLAILLLFVAPVISKSLAQRYGGSGMMMHHAMAGMMMSAGDHHPAMAMSAQDQPATTMAMPAQDHHPMSMMDDSACGYCVLLVHLSLILPALPLLWSARQAAAPPAVPLLQPVIARFVPRFFHPRAPPAPVVLR